MQDNLAKQKSNIVMRKSKNLAMAFIILSDIAKIDLNLGQSIKTDAIDFFKDMSIGKGYTHLDENIINSIARNIYLFDSYAKLIYQQQKISVSNYHIIHEHVKSIERDIEIYKNNFYHQQADFTENQIQLAKVLKDNLENDSAKKDNIISHSRNFKKDNISHPESVKDINTTKNTKSIDIVNRHEKILLHLKNNDNFSITQLSKFFPEVATKTLQRDLNSLLLDGKVKVYGTRRWARYSAK